MDNKLIIKEFRSYVDSFVECCTSDHETHELLKAVDKLIEEQEERIAIMSEGGWHDAKTDPPKKPGTYIVYVKVLGERIPYVSFCDYQIKTTGFDLEGNAMVLKWQSMPKPPVEGGTE